MMNKIYDIDPVLVDVPMPIVTPRLILRPPQAGDGAALADAKRASWPELKPWMPWATGKVEDISDETDEIMCRTKYAKYLLREDLMMFAFDRAANKLVASTGLHRMDWRARMFEIGYWVRSDETGQGYATEVTNALLRYAFNQLGANRIYIAHDDANDASRAVIEKLGFVKEGHTRLSDIRSDRLSGTMHYARYDLEGLPELDVRWGVEP